MKDNTNRDACLNAIWNDPARLFGGQWKQTKGGNAWEYQGGGEYGPRGAVRLIRQIDRVNFTVMFNHGSGHAGEHPDGIQYAQQYRLNTSGFEETLKGIAELYNLTLEFTNEERRAIDRAQLARELAPSFVEALRQHPDGATAKYIRDKRGLIPDARFGELTAETLKRALEHLKNRGIAYTDEDLDALGVSAKRANAGYNCLIPYTVNGRVVGFLTRYTGTNPEFKKYLYSAGMVRGGYCDALASGKPAVVVEGPMDAIRLMQLGVENVVAIGGAKIGEEIGRLLRGHGIVEVFYIPDHETDLNKQRDTSLVIDAIKAFQSVRVNDTPVVERLYIVDLPAPEDWTKYPKYGHDGKLKGYKIDADAYGAEHPDELRRLVDVGGVVSWEWELEQLMAWAVAQDNAAGFVGYNEFQKRFNDIYTRCGSPWERDRIRQHIRGNKVFEAFGITPQSCEHADEWKRADERKQQLTAAAADLNRAVQEQADPETLAAIVRRINAAQGAAVRDEWDAQLAETFDDELEAIRDQPETLKTLWEVGDIIGKRTEPNNPLRYVKYENIEFYPADIEVFCAPTSHGKTLILFQAAFDLLNRYPDKTFLYISCEENKRQLVERALSVFIDIPTTPTGKYKDDNGREQYCFVSKTRKKAIKAAIRDAAPPEAYESYMGVSKHFNAVKEAVQRQIQAFRDNIRPRLKFVHTEASAESICNNVVRFVEESRNNGVEVGAVFVDYMQLLTMDAANYSRHDELKDICKALKDCAARIELPVVIAAQLNREVLRAVSGYGSGFDNLTEANIGEGADIERIAHDIYLVWQIKRTPKGQYYKTTDESGEPKLEYKKIGLRSRRLFDSDEFGKPSELKNDYMYIEQLKARDGESGGWGLFPFDGERGRIGTIDTDAMMK